MHTGKSYRLPEFLAWTRRTIYLLLVLSVVPVLLYQLAGWTWLAVPWGVVLLVGTTAALSAGFKSVQTYNRMQDAQQAWSAIASASRIWATSCRDLAVDADAARGLVYRYLGWLTALRYQMRQPRAWETLGAARNVEYRSRYVIPEREQPLATELARYLSQGETAQVIEADNGALQVLALQGAATRSLLMEGALDAAGFAELQRQLRGLHELQGRSERIKDFPYPRQHAFINALFLRILCVLVPFGMLGEAERLNGLVSGWAQGQMVWLTIPLSLLVSWMYTSLDQVGESTENPFEGGANDVPISAICQDIERDLREVLGEGSVPRAMGQAGDITV